PAPDKGHVARWNASGVGTGRRACWLFGGVWSRVGTFRMLVVSCPFCFIDLRLDAASPGETVRCPQCANAWVLDALALQSRDPEAADGPAPFAFAVTEPPPPPAATHCLGCGRQMRNRLRCGRCGSTFCSEMCVRRHAKMTGHSSGAGCATVVVSLVVLVVLARLVL